MMKKINLIGLIAGLMVCANISSQQLSLTDNWLFKQADKNEWKKAVVPGQVHTDLLANQLIPDPFYGSNEKDLQWIGEKNWEYTTSFDVHPDLLSKSGIDLVFEGLDTYADVYLNDILILKADNMFRTWKLDVKPYLKEKGNRLYILFHSVYEVDMPKYLQAPFKLQAWPNNDQRDPYLSLYARKAGYNYGWDWGPRLLTAGIWRPVSLQAWDSYRINDVQVLTNTVNDKEARMTAFLNVESMDDQQAVDIQISYNNNSHHQKTSLQKGKNRIRFDFTLSKPQLWWSNGLGKPNLYTFDCRLKAAGKEVHMPVTTGIRTIEIVREKDAAGRSMYVKLNGHPVFMKGANYIPLDNFPNRVKDSDYEHIIKSAADANMNMLRVWGGGIYEKDIFYDLCDQYGILVWQDMMFACGMFPSDEHYLQNVSQEVTDNVTRLRNHPCIALWNGNNENEISYYGWGWRDKYDASTDQVYTASLRKLFYDVIPNAIHQADETHYYHPTSPVTGYNDMGYNMGDVHLWTVWKGTEVEDYLVSVGRFMSEYGFQSYPDLTTINKFSKAEDQYLSSPVMLSHQRAKNDETRDPEYGNKMMKSYMEKYFRVPDNFEDFLYMSQYQQAEIVKVAMESHRRHMPYCMGTLYWQINDCWPVASWSSIDYYGRWKALQYYAKKAYNELLVSPYTEKDRWKIKIVNDRLAAAKGELLVQVMGFDGKIYYDKKIPVTIKPESSEDYFNLSSEELLGNASTPETFVYTSLTVDSKMISDNIFYAGYANKYHYPAVNIQQTITSREDGFNIHLESAKLVRGVYLYTENETDFFSDNYFTIIPGRPIDIHVKSNLPVALFEKQLKIKTYNQIQNHE